MKHAWVAVYLLVAGSAAYAHWPLAPLPSDTHVDTVQVEKQARVLTLLHEGKPVRSYRISLGGDPVGHKQQQGDERTPEGTYVLDWRNPNSCCYRSLHVSYPNEDDQARADAGGYSPGGDIMIHGLVNGTGWLGRLHRLWDWTDGCVAVTNAEMAQIWDHVPNGTPITLRP
ncbi:MAG: L,D-transpeptidase family protein [Bacteroidota bacterium]